MYIGSPEKMKKKKKWTCYGIVELVNIILYIKKGIIKAMIRLTKTYDANSGK